MKVFLTGHRGYVGNVMHKMLTKNNYDVVGCDVGFYPEGFIEISNNQENSISKDIRDVTEDDISDCSAIIHLAALSNDPLGEMNSSLTHDINFLATLHLAKLAKKVGIERFIYSSSCSTYGTNSDLVDENSSLAPITAYAKSKVNSELELIKLKDENFFPVILRNATAFGASSSQRLDIVVNNLTCSAYATGKVKLLSDGTAWRPLIHVEDMSQAFIECLKAPTEKIRGEIFNVGGNEENYTVREIAESVEDIVPDSIIEYSNKSNKDSRSYKVSFDKIKNQLNFKPKWTLRDGIKQMYDIVKKKNFTEETFRDKKYYRVIYIQWLLEQGKIDNNLRFK